MLYFWRSAIIIPRGVGDTSDRIPHLTQARKMLCACPSVAPLIRVSDILIECLFEYSVHIELMSCYFGKLSSWFGDNMIYQISPKEKRKQPLTRA